MGTWGVHSFENDSAVEWATAYRDMGLSLAASTIRIALEDHAAGRLTADIALRAVAAAEAVAQALGRGTEEAAKLFAGAPETDPQEARKLVAEAGELVAAVSGGSALSEVWKRTGRGEHEAWLASMDALRTRLSVKAPPQAAPEAAPAAPRNASARDEILRAIAGLSQEIEALRQETRDGLARLARRVEEIGR